MTKSHESHSENALLPLVLVTVGSGDDEIEALHLHLESIVEETEPQFQSLIVARSDLPRKFYHMLCERIRPMPNVYVRRLGENEQNCDELLHETGTFLVNRKRSDKEE